MLYQHWRIHFCSFVSVILLLPILRLNPAPAWSQSLVVPNSTTTESVALEQELIESELSKARELREHQEFEAAIALYLQILQQDPRQRQAREELALTYAYNQELDKSIYLYRELISEEPENIDLQLQLARITSWKKAYLDAISIYDKILAQDPDNAKALLAKAEVLSWAGRYDESIKTYEEILLKDPSNFQAKLGQAQVTAWANRYRQSLQLYNEILRRYPNLIEALQGRAQVTLWSQQTQKAIALYQEAIKQFPQSQELRLDLARIYKSQQKISKALEVLKPLIDSKNKEALQIVRDIQAVQSTTSFRSEHQKDGQANQSIQQTLRFRIANSDTVQEVKAGISSFEQRGFEKLNNIPLEVGIEGKAGQVDIRAAVGADFFNRLDSVPRVMTEVGGEILPNVRLAVVTEYGAYKFNVESLENEITAFQLGPDIYWQIDRSTGLFALYRWGSYNDGNYEHQFFGRIERRIGDFFVAGSLFNWSYAEDLNNGYFAPPDFLTYAGEVGWEANLSDPFKCKLSASLGKQRFIGELTNANTYKARCTAKISSDFEADLGYIYTNIRDQATGNNSNKSEVVTGQIRFIF